MRCIHYLELRYPCGQCNNCRINHQSELALRINHELQYHNDSVFVTLTYAPEHLPAGNTLVKSDVQKFIKRVRKRLGDDHLRYFASGEYGENATLRPHYHLILFGVGMRDQRLFKNVRYVPGEGNRADCLAWKKGFVTVDKVTNQRINYVAKYCLKKVTGVKSKEFYGDRLPEFSLCSRNPGLGYQYMMDHASRLREDDFCTVRGVKHPLPRYYVDKLFSVGGKLYRSIKRNSMVEKKLEEHRSEYEKYTPMEYAQLLKDKVDLAKEIMARRIQMKGKTKCQVK